MAAVTTKPGTGIDEAKAGECTVKVLADTASTMFGVLRRPAG